MTVQQRIDIDNSLGWLMDLRAESVMVSFEDPTYYVGLGDCIFEMMGIRVAGFYIDQTKQAHLIDVTGWDANDVIEDVWMHRAKLDMPMLVP